MLLGRGLVNAFSHFNCFLATYIFFSHFRVHFKVIFGNFEWLFRHLNAGNGIIIIVFEYDLTHLWKCWIISGACGAMDNASDYGSEDSRFESWQARIFLIYKIVSFIQHCYWERKPLTRLQRIVFTWEEICAFKLLISSPKSNNGRCLFGHM